jgi:DNA polymerase-3 subunit alpha
MSNGVTNIDSVTKYQSYIERAKECGMSALGFSEHGSVFAWDLKKEDIEKAGMKYIHAEEFYLTETLDEKVRDNYHCVLIAKNIKGVKELNLLSTKSFNRSDNHFYYVPRITIDDVINTSDNIIVTSACLGGPLNHGTNNVQGKFLKFFCEHKDRCFLEVQHHNVGDQIAYNRKLYRISLETGIRLIAGTDTHSLNAEKAEGRSVLQRGKDIFFGDEEGWDLIFKTYDELVEAYRKQNSIPEQAYMEAIENTNVMANMIEPFEIDRHTKYPKIYKDPEKTFKQKINEGYKNNKYLHERYTKEEVVSRIKEEFEVYKKVGAIDFMLLESYIREWERNNGVQSGYSRGSVSGSLIAYALGITQMDSLKFHLNFFRFMNPSRVTNADIDTDYCSKDRDKIKYFLLHDKMDLLDINPNIRTTEIITFNTADTKGAVKDICRALYRKDKEDKGYLPISDFISKSIDAGREEEMRKQYPDVFKYVDIISGTIVSLGTHPSGVLVSDRNIEEDIGLCSIATSPYPVSMLDMHGLDGQMYVKLKLK